MKFSSEPPTAALFLEVSKRGWRTEGVGAKKPFKGQRFRPLFCTLFSYAPLGEWGRISGELLGLFLGVSLSATPSRQPLFETSDIFCGEIETSRLKLSSEIENFDRDRKFRSGANVFDRWALWVLSPGNR